MSYDYETMGEEVLGDEVLGYHTVGAARGSGLLRMPGIQRAVQVKRNAPQPAWRSRLAPGVPTPGYGMQPLPLVPSNGTGIFAAATTAISFTARPQAPFRSERLLASVRRSGAAAITVLATNFFVGRDLQLVELGSFDIEFFTSGAFGVRLALSQAEPGQLIRIDCATSSAPGGQDTLTVSLLILGQTVT